MTLKCKGTSKQCFSLQRIQWTGSCSGWLYNYHTVNRLTLITVQMKESSICIIWIFNIFQLNKDLCNCQLPSANEVLELFDFNFFKKYRLKHTPEHYWPFYRNVSLVNIMRLTFVKSITVRLRKSSMYNRVFHLTNWLIVSWG